MLLTIALSALLSAPSSGTLDLAQALDKAQASNPAVTAARARMLEARATVRQSEGASWPSLSIPAGYTRNANGQFVSLNGQDEYTLEAAVHLPLFDPARASENQAARARAERAALQLDMASHDLDGEVVAAYFRVLETQARLAVQRAGAQTLSDELGVTLARFRQGLSSSLDGDRARFAVASQLATVAAALSQEQIARQHLASLMGSPTPADLAVPPAAPALPAKADLEALALLRRPEIAAGSASVAAHRDQMEAEAARRWVPDIGSDLAAGWDSNGPLQVISSQYGWSASLSLSEPLYSGGVVSAGIERARQALAAARADYQGQIRMLSLALADDVRAQDAARKQLALAIARDRIVHQELAMTRIGYQSGSVPFIELLRTERNAITAAADHVAATLALERAQYQLAWEVGFE